MSGIISRFAGSVDASGNPVPGYSGDGSAATSARLNYPDRIALDSSGNVYISDTSNHLIRKIDTAGIITTIAGFTDASGNPNPGYSGDGGPATSAKLSSPSGIALDSSGNLYIADTSNHLIRKIDTAGIITTFAGSLDASGNPSAGYSGDGGAATNAKLNVPRGIDLDSSGNLYICDYANSLIRKIDSAGIITRISGSVDASGNPNPGYSGDGGPATSAQLTEPFAITLDSSGNIYITDYGNYIIRKIDPVGIITRFAGSVDASGVPVAGGYSGDGDLATSTTLGYPGDIALDSSGNLYFSDSANNLILKIDTAGIITTIAGSVDASGNPSTGYSGDGGPATSARLTYPSGVALDSSGNLYISDSGNHLIRKVTAQVPPPAPANAPGFVSKTSTTIIVTGDSTVELGGPFSAVTFYIGVGDEAPTEDKTPGTVENGVYTHVFSGLSQNTEYSITWALATASGESDPSPSLPVTTDIDENAPSQPPQLTIVSQTSTSVTVTGNSSTVSNGTFIGVRFYQSSSANGYNNIVIGSPQENNGVYTFTYTGLTPGFTLYLSWSLENAIGYGATSNRISVTTNENPVCFVRGSRILCLNEGLKEEYMAIEDMRVGTKVKTLNGSFVKVHTIGSTMFNNPDNADRGPNRLFKLSPENYPELTEDLIITGCHSRLVDKLEPKQKARHLQLMKSLYMTTGKFRLMAFIDEKAEPYQKPGPHEIWHFALENEEEVCNYGVYANGGLLVETASIKNMRERSGFALIE